MGAGAVDIADELLKAILAIEDILTGVALVVLAQVGQGDSNTSIEEREFAHAVGQNVVLIFGGDENGVVWPELLACTTEFGLTHNLDVVEGLSLLVFLLVNLIITENLTSHVLGKSINATDAHAMQTSRDLVASLVELTSSMQHSHNDFQSALVLLLVHIHRDASSIVLNGDAPVFVDGDFDMCTKASQGFVNTVVHRLVDEMVKSLLRNVTDVHCRTLAHGLQSFEDLNVTRAVVRAVLDFFFHCYVSNSLFRWINVPYRGANTSLWAFAAQS